MPSRRDTAVAELVSTVQHHQASVADFDRETARLLGVNDTDLRCLEILLDATTEITPSLLAGRLGLTTGSVTTMLDRLTAMGHVTRSPHPTDRRRTVVHATPTIVDRVRDLYAPLVQEGHDDLLPRYTAEQLEVITDFLRRDTDLHHRHTQRLRDLKDR